MVNIPDRDADLRLYYDQVIDTHKKLAVVLSDVAGKVVDGRIPNHDLPKMLEDFAEREEIMADNWTLIRDGLFSKAVDNAALQITDVSTAVYANDGNKTTESRNRMSKKRKLDHSEQPESEACRALSRSGNETYFQENTQWGAQPQVKPVEKILDRAQIRKMHETLTQTQQGLKRGAYKTGNQVWDALRSRDELEFKLQEQNRLRRLKNLKTQQIAKAKQEAKEAEKLAREASACQIKQEKDENRARMAAKRSTRAQRRAIDAERLDKEVIEGLEKQQKKRDARVRQLALEVERLAAEASTGLEKRQGEAETATQHEKIVQDNRERDIRRMARNKAEDVAEASGQPTLTFPPPRRLLQTLTYQAEDLVVKEEVIEAWEI